MCYHDYMHNVYVLRDENGRLYKGMSGNLKQRVSEHKKGYVRSTRSFKNLNLVYSEEFFTRNEARKREKYLKSAAGRKFLQNKLHEGP